MSYKNDFNAFVGGKSGIFKGVKVSKEACVTKHIQSLVSIKDHDEVTTVSWGDAEEREVLIACGVKGDRSVKVYDTESSTFTCSFFCDTGEGSINGISRYDRAILTAVTSGEIKLWRFNEKEQFVIDAGPNLRRMKHSTVNKNIIATGGQENKLKLFDLEKQSQIFIEKNLPHDWLQLKVPVWISDIGFLPNTQQVVTAGRYGHIRLYDHNAQRRPVINLEIKDEALTALSVTSRERQIVVGSGKGRMNLVDLRNPGKVLNTYKGCVGGITGVACSLSEPYIVSVGLDRYLRVHHMDTKELVKSVYLTSRLTCVLLRSEFSLSAQSKDNGEHVNSFYDNNDNKNGDANCESSQQDVESDAEYDALFGKMQTITSDNEDKDTEQSNKKRKRMKQLTNNEDAPESITEDATQSRSKRKKKSKRSKKSNPTE